MNVLEAARERLRVVFDNFDNVIVSFSAGKDSGVMLHLALEAAANANRLPLDVMFIDLEAQYAHTAGFAERMLRRPDVRPTWFCLPLHLRNSVSQFQPFWKCWDPAASDRWVRPMPPEAVSTFDGFREGMEFEDFVPAYQQRVARGRTAVLVGIRADESLNRWRTVSGALAKQTWNGRLWTTDMGGGVFNVYPIYDWKTPDVWTANGHLGLDYNRVYDLMHLAGVPLSQMRLCQPYGDDQRKGLWLFKILEPETWSRVVARVEGANFGERHVGDRALGRLRVDLPAGLTWKAYTELLLDTMPPHLAEHYRRKIDRFLAWWRTHGYLDGIPDAADPKEEAAKKCPSWRRIAKVIVKNDYWCKGLSFAMTKREHDRRLALALSYMEKTHEPD